MKTPGPTRDELLQQVRQLEERLREAEATIQALRRAEAAGPDEEHFQQLAEELSATNEELQQQAEQLQSQAEELAVQNDELERLSGELEAERALLHTVLDQMPGGVIIAEAPSGKFHLVNRQMEAILGQPLTLADNLKGYRPDGSPFRPQDYPLARALTGKKTIEREINIIRGDGAPGVIQVSAAPVHNHRGEIIAAVATYRDITLRQQREREIQRQASFPRLNRNPVLEVATSGRIIFANQAASEIIERQGPPATISDFVPQDLDDILREFKNSGQAHCQRELTINDTVFLLSVAYAEQFDTVRLYGIDITQRKKTEESLAQSNKRTVDILESINDAFFSLNNDKVITYFNKAAAQILGRDREAVLGMKLLDAFPEARGSIFEQKYIEALREGKPLSFEAYFEPQPYRNWYDVRVFPYEDGISVYFVVTTERKQAEAAMQRTKEEWERTFDAVPDLIAILDQDHHLVRVNRAMAQALEIKPEDLVGKPCYEFMHQTSSPPSTCPHSQLLLDGQRHDAEFQVLGRDFLVTVSPLTDAQGNFSGSVHLARDITERKAAEEALRQALDEAERRHRETEALLHASRAVMDHQTFKDAAWEIFKDCQAMTGAQAGYVALLSPDGTQNEVLFLDAGGRSCTVDPDLPMPIRGLRAEAYRTGAMVFDNNFAASSHTAFLPPGHVTLDNVLFAPMVHEGKVIGLIGLANKPGGFTDHDARLAAGFGDLAAIALVNRRAQEELQQAHAELEQQVKERTAELRLTVEALQEEVEERQRAEDTIGTSHHFLEMMNRHTTLPTLLQDFVAEVKNLSQCAAVGIRLLDEAGNIPYQEYFGFSKEFYELESPLSIHSDQCMCINVIKGTTNPQQPFYTPGGSFYMNGTTRFLATVSKEDKGASRNVCNSMGFESVALVPIRLSERILGLIHLADPKEYMVSREKVELLELVALQLGASLQRIKSQEDLTRERQRFYDVLEMLPAYLVLLTPDHQVPYANRYFTERFGASNGRRCFEYLFGRTKPCEICESFNILKTNKPQRWEWIGPDGRNYEVYDYPFTDVDGSPLIMEMGIDITERKQAEKQAETISRLYRVLSRVNETIVRAAAPETLFRETCRIAVKEGGFMMAWVGLTDPDGKVVKPVAQYGHDEGYLDNLVITLKDGDECRGPTGTSVREGRFDICNDFAADPRMAPWQEKALAQGYLSSGAFPLRVGEQVVGALTIYADKPDFFNEEETALLEALTEDLSFALESMEREAGRRRAETEVQKLNEELEQRVKERTAQLEAANREMEAFSYSVSHDLKAPIRAIDGFSKMLLIEHTSNLDPEALRLLGVIRHNTAYMARLIDDLLALSRLGRREIRKSGLDLAAMSATAFAELKTHDPERRIALTVKDMPPAFGDPSLLHQVLVNLLSNAFKFTKFKDDASLEVGGWSAEGEKVYYVKDNGVGFDMRFANKLFGVFQRLHKIGEFDGTGVGLAIVQRIIQRHGGRVWAEARVDEGATFYFALPAE